jgi:hypothetical protein
MNRNEVEEAVMLPPMQRETSADEPSQKVESHTETGVSKSKGIAVIITLAGINFLNTMGSGILIAALPRIARDLSIPDGLILW